MSMVPALGLLLSSEGSAACVCAYSFQTSLALVPAAARKNEDWAALHGPLPVGIFPHMALNFVAPGDRRDDEGVLWLGFPRPSPKLSLQVPCSLDVREGFGPYRFNADRLSIAGTDRPWIYASGIRGLERAVLKLTWFGRALSYPCEHAPKVDGQLRDPCWDGRSPVGFAPQKASTSSYSWTSNFAARIIRSWIRSTVSFLPKIGAYKKQISTPRLVSPLRCSSPASTLVRRRSGEK